MKLSLPVSVIIPTKNSETTIEKSIYSLLKQSYPIKEVLIIDNHSTDRTKKIILEIKKNSKVPIKTFFRNRNFGLGSSLNFGANKAKSPLLIFFHSDCYLSTTKELKKLLTPVNRSFCIASYPSIILSHNVWNKYTFWEKAFFCREVGRSISGFTTKFDCVKKYEFDNLNGFDTSNFGVGGEDYDLFYRLKKRGKVAKSSAKVFHLHYLGDYDLGKFLIKRKIYARTYGRIIKKRGISLFPQGFVLFLKPLLVLIPFIPDLFMIGIMMIIVYSFLSTRKMFITSSTLSNPRIFILPFINIFTVYYETFWMFESLFFGKNKIE